MLTKVWNTTNTNRMVLGKVTKPGRCVATTEKESTLHKVRKSVANRDLAVSDVSILSKPPRAVADARVVHSNGTCEGAKRIVPNPSHGEGWKEGNAPVETKEVETKEVVAVSDESGSFRKKFKKGE